MDIGFVVHDYDVREGHGRYSVELISRISRVHKVTLYATNVSHDPPPPPGVDVVKVPTIRRPSYATILTFPTAFAVMRRRHDLIHTQGWNTTSADIATAHICIAAWRLANMHAPAGSGFGEKVLGRYVERRERNFYRNGVQHIIVPSNRVRLDLEKHYGVSAEVSVIPHGFPDAVVAPPPPPPPPREQSRRELRLPQDVFVAFYAGDARKGLDVTLRAVAGVDAIHLLVVSRSKLRYYQSLASQLGIENRTYWVPGLPDLAAAYAASDLLIHPTVYDAFGLVVAEALACGLPVIVSREAGITELLEDRRSAWLVRAGSLEDCTEALHMLSSDRRMLAEFATAAKEAAGQRTWDDVAAETMALYEKVAAKR